MDNWWERLAAFSSQSADPVLPPFRQARSPFRNARIKFIAFALFIFIGFFYGFWGSILPSSFVIYLAIPIVLLLGLILWAMPDARHHNFVAIGWAYIAYSLVMYVWPNYLALNLGGLPWISMRRLAGVSLIIFFIFSLSHSKYLRDFLKNSVNEIPYIWRFLIAFYIISFANIFISDNLNHSYKLWFNNQYAWTAVFFAGVYLMTKPKFTKNWLILLAVMGIFTAVIGVYEQTNQKLPWADSVPQFLMVEVELLEKILTPSFRGGLYRSQSIFSNALPFSQFLAVISIIILHFAVAAKSNAARLFLIATQVIVLMAIVYTRARLGLIGFIVGHALYALVWGLRRQRFDRSSIIGAAISYGYPALILSFAFLVNVVDALRIRIIGSGTAAASNNARDQQWSMSPQAIMESPFIGHGSGMGATALGYKNQSGATVIDSHVLTVILDYGIVGAIGYFGAILMLIFVALKWSLRLPNTLPKDQKELGLILPLGVMLVVFLVIKWVFAQEENDSLMWMTMGAIIAMNYRLNREWVDKDTPPPVVATEPANVKGSK